jgi:hypothetical protein
MIVFIIYCVLLYSVIWESFSLSKLNDCNIVLCYILSYIIEIIYCDFLYYVIQEAWKLYIYPFIQSDLTSLDIQSVATCSNCQYIERSERFDFNQTPLIQWLSLKG